MYTQVRIVKLHTWT